DVFVSLDGSTCPYWAPRATRMPIWLSPCRLFANHRSKRTIRPGLRTGTGLRATVLTTLNSVVFSPMLGNLFREIAVDPPAKEQLLQPLHDSPVAKTRVIPSSPGSKQLFP